jgi:hypothetical protein
VAEAEVVPGVGIRWFAGNYFIKQLYRLVVMADFTAFTP